MDSSLLETIELTNPWLLEPARFLSEATARLGPAWVPRRGAATTEWPVAKKAHVVVGARQVGKSSFLWSWFASRGQAPLFVNADEPIFQRWCTSAARFGRDVAELVGPDVPVFFEEVQRLENAGLFLKALIDARIPNPIFATGSSAFHLQDRHRESLAGRAVRHEMHPFSLAEVTADADSLAPALRQRRRQLTAERMTCVGGYPDVWLAPTPESAAHALVNSVVLRDASDRWQVQHIDAFRRLLRLIAQQIGNLINVSEWASICDVSRPTIDAYLTLLEDGHIIGIVPPFVGGKRAELTGRPKAYFRDMGLRNAVTANFAPLNERADAGAAFEGFVYAELRKLVSPLAPVSVIRFWRSKSGAEVDFVIGDGPDILAVEAKATALTGPKLSRSARSFIEAYEPREFWVVNRGYAGEERGAVAARTTVRWCTPDHLATVPAGLPFSAFE